MSEQHPGGIPAGWYEDPQSAQALRYWDGSRWTGSVRARSDAPLPGTPADLTDDAQPTQALTSPAPDHAIADVANLEPAAGGASADEEDAGQPADDAAGGVPAEEGRAARRAQASGARWSLPPAARKWAAIGGAGVLVLSGLGLVIARPWDTTPETCAEAVSALAGGSADQQILAAITEECRSLEEFAGEAAKYPESFAVDGLAPGVASLCEQVPGAGSSPLCVEAAAAQPADPSASPAPQA